MTTDPLHALITTAATLLLEFGLHFIPWPALLCKRELPRPIAYTIGVVGLNIPLTVYALLAATALPVWLVWANCAAGGLGVIAGYGIDKWLSYRNRAELVDAVEDMRHASYDHRERV
jgi:hypothetical protein